MSVWLSQNWFNAAQTAAIVLSLLLTMRAVRASERSSRATNLLTVTGYHREIWKQVIEKPELESVLRAGMGPDEQVREDERRFVLQLILHLSSVYQILRLGALDNLEGLRRDIYDFMNLPVPQAVWREFKQYQNRSFVEFVDACIAGRDLDAPIRRRSPTRNVLSAARAGVRPAVVAVIRWVARLGQRVFRGLR
jgi:hypothetical protein